MNNVDNIRLEQFRQIMKEIRGSKEYLIIGISRHMVCHINAEVGRLSLFHLVLVNSS
jgi:hypothetical protein